MFKDQLVSVFTNDVDIAFEAKKLVSIIAWILPLMMLSFLSMSVGRGSGHMLFPTVNNIVRFWLIRIGLGYILAISFGECQRLIDIYYVIRGCRRDSVVYVD
jgi:Na+-driven multidrug efflux pump